MSGLIRGGFLGLVVGGVVVVGASLMAPPIAIQTTDEVADVVGGAVAEPVVADTPVAVETPVEGSAPDALRAVSRTPTVEAPAALAPPITPETSVASVDTASPPAPAATADEPAADVVEPVQIPALDATAPSVATQLAGLDAPVAADSPANVAQVVTAPVSAEAPAPITAATPAADAQAALQTTVSVAPEIAPTSVLSDPPMTPETVDVVASADAPVLPTLQGLQPAPVLPEVPVAVDTTPTLAPVVVVVDPPEAAVPAPDTALDTSIDTATAAPATPAAPVQPLADPSPEVAVETQTDPTPQQPSEDETAPPEVVSLAQAPTVTVLPSGTGAVRVNRLTGAGNLLTSSVVPEAAVETPDADVVGDDADEDMTAFARYAVPAENPDNLPEMSVVLIDDPTRDDVISVVAGIGFPVSVMLNPTIAGAADRMRAYRAAGIEVGLVATLPPAATATDVAIFYEAALTAVPETIAALDFGTDGPANADLIRQAAAALAEDGRGLITQPRGLNTAQRVAAEVGLPSGMIYRYFDEAGQDARAIKRFLDQAAFQARQNTGVIMVGQVRDETLTALSEWGAASRAGQVALVPVSSVMDLPE